MATLKILAKNLIDNALLNFGASGGAVAALPLDNVKVYGNSRVFRSSSGVTQIIEGSFNPHDLFGAGNLYPKGDFDTAGDSIGTSIQFVGSIDAPVYGNPGRFLGTYSAQIYPLTASVSANSVGVRFIGFTGGFRRNTYYNLSFWARIITGTTSGGFSTNDTNGVFSANPALNSTWQMYVYRINIGSGDSPLFMRFLNAAAMSSMGYLEFSNVVLRVDDGSAPLGWAPYAPPSGFTNSVNTIALWRFFGIGENDGATVRVKLYPKFIQADDEFNEFIFDSGEIPITPQAVGNDFVFDQVRSTRAYIGKDYMMFFPPSYNNISKSFRITIKSRSQFDLARIYMGHSIDFDVGAAYGYKNTLVDDSEPFRVGDRGLYTPPAFQYRKITLPLMRLRETERYWLCDAYSYCGKSKDLFVAAFAGEGGMQEGFNAMACKISNNLELMFDGHENATSILELREC